MTTQQLLENAKSAKAAAMLLDTEKKNTALLKMADKLIEHTDKILAANKIDVENAKGIISDVMIDRLSLSEDRIRAMAQGIRDVASLPDPVGSVIERTERENGLVIEKTSVPIGVTAIIYESHPNVTADAAGLFLKTGNAVLLRCSGDAINSNKAIVKVLQEACEKSNIPSGAIQLVEDTSRACANEMMRLNQYLDVLIPRGGAGLIQSVLKKQ